MMRLRGRRCCRSPRDQETNDQGTIWRVLYRRITFLYSPRIGKCSVVHGQTNVVFGQSLRCRSGAGDVIEFGDLAAFVEWIVGRKAVQHRSHPPGKSLYFPDAAQANLRVTIEELRLSVFVEFTQCAG